MSPSTVIITATDSNFFPLACETIRSIRDKPEGQNVSVGLFDLGCTPPQLEELQSLVDIIQIPEWEFSFPLRDESPHFLKGLLARPFLRSYFPGFEIYLWIDADAWIQNWSSIELFIEGAVRRGLAVVPEIDRANKLQYGHIPAAWDKIRNDYTVFFGAEIAEEFHSYPIINAGVFALAKDSPHWGLWKANLQTALNKKAHIFTDQFALNITIYRDLQLEHTELLPLWCNWTCHFGPPAWDSKRQRFVEPFLPNTEIGIIHLTSVAKNLELADTVTPEGNKIQVSLRYPQIGNEDVSSFSTLENSETTFKQIAQTSIPTEIQEASISSSLATSSENSTLDAYSNDRDYISPELKTVIPDEHFPNLAVGDKKSCSWRYLRKTVPHKWYVDQRAPHIGFVNRDEASILYNTALMFPGQPALEIGCWLGWSLCHLALGGITLDVIDPILGNLDFRQSVEDSLRSAGVFDSVRVYSSKSPDAVEKLYLKSNIRWPLIFIDGDHIEPGPLNDAIVCEKYAAADSIVLFHDLVSPDVAQGLDYFKSKGWKTLIYQTMQIMGVAWRGDVEPIHHIPDPDVNWLLPDHLQQYPLSGINDIPR